MWFLPMNDGEVVVFPAGKEAGVEIKSKKERL